MKKIAIFLLLGCMFFSGCTSSKNSTQSTIKPSAEKVVTTATTTKVPETTTISTEKPDVKPTGHCEGFDKLWGKTLPELEESLKNIGFYYYDGWEYERSGARYLSFWDNFNIFDITIPYGCSCYSNTQGVSLLYEIQSSEELHNVYGFKLWGDNSDFDWCEHCDNNTGELSPDFNTIYNKLNKLYGEPNKSRLEGELKVYLWNNTLDGDILLSNCTDINAALCYDTVVLYVLDSNHKLSEGNIDYYFSLEI